MWPYLSRQMCMCAKNWAWYCISVRLFRFSAKLICFPVVLKLCPRPTTQHSLGTWYKYKLSALTPDLLNQKLWSRTQKSEFNSPPAGSGTHSRLRTTALHWVFGGGVVWYAAEKELVLGLAFSFLASFHLLCQLVQLPVVSLDHCHTRITVLLKSRFLKLLDYASQGIALVIHSTAQTPSVVPTVHRAKSKLLDKAIRWSLWPRGISCFFQPRPHCWIHCAHIAESLWQEWPSFLFQMWPPPWNLILSGSFSISASQTLLHIHHAISTGKLIAFQPFFPRPLNSYLFVLAGKHQHQERGIIC